MGKLVKMSVEQSRADAEAKKQAELEKKAASTS